MDTGGAILPAERQAAQVSTPAVVACLSPRVLTRALGPTTGLALWHRTGRVASRQAAQAALALAPFSKVTEGTPDRAMRGLLQDMPAVMRPLGADIMLLGRLFASLTTSSTVCFRLEHVVDDACRRYHVDAVRLRLLCTYAGLGTDWIDPAGAYRRMAVFDVGVFKGSKFPDSAPRILHRSPPVEHLPKTRRSRLLLCIDQPGVF